MAYCKLEETARYHYKFNQMAQELGIKRAEARGLFFGLCAWAVTNAPDGCLDGFSDADIEAAADWQGRKGRLIPVLISCLLLEESDSGRNIHDFIDRNESFRKALSKRKERELKKNVVRQSNDSRATVAQRGDERKGDEMRGDDLTATSTTAQLSIVPVSAPPPRVEKRQPEVFRVRDMFCELYQELYGVAYEWDHARDGKQAKLLVGKATGGVEQLLAELDAYFGWRDPTVIADSHTFSHGRASFVTQRHRLRADMAAPERHETAAILRQERYEKGRDAYVAKKLGQ